MRMIKEEHIAVTEEPVGKYLTHSVPEDPIYPEKPALKTAQALYTILEKFDSLESLQILQGDSTNTNTLGGVEDLMPCWRNFLEENYFGEFATFTP
jgi:hypothetical protein